MSRNAFIGMFFLATFPFFLMPLGIGMILLCLKKSTRSQIWLNKKILFASIVITYSLWFSGMFFGSGDDRAYSNVLYEPLLMGTILAFINGFYTLRPPKNIIFWLFLIIINPLLIYFLMPELPASWFPFFRNI